MRGVSAIVICGAVFAFAVSVNASEISSKEESKLFLIAKMENMKKINVTIDSCMQQISVDNQASQICKEASYMYFEHLKSEDASPYLDRIQSMLVDPYVSVAEKRSLMELANEFFFRYSQLREKHKVMLNKIYAQ